MKIKSCKTLLIKALSLFVPLISLHADGCDTLSTADRIAMRDYPSVFQAWYGVDMPEVPLETKEQRIRMSARHDVMWEEPLSQLGEGVDLVLGLVWDAKHYGLATGFTESSLQRALDNRDALLECNPNMLMLAEIRWRDAPSTFLPEDSDWWMRDETGKPKVGWTGGWVPFWMLNYENPDFQNNVARQAAIAIKSGVYDGVMLDWSGHLEIIRKVREAIGDEALIIVNIHDDIEKGKLYAPYINGSFMECNPQDATSIEKRNNTTWDKLREAIIWFEQHLREPKINCLEVWGDRRDLSRMRATTALGLVYSNGSVLYGDPNPLKTPDHLHDWYGFWDVPLGRPTSNACERPDGAAERSFEGGVVIYNHEGNQPVTIEFKQDKTRASDMLRGSRFTVNPRDGDIFIDP